jgi:hypothetical protein
MANTSIAITTPQQAGTTAAYTDTAPSVRKHKTPRMKLDEVLQLLQGLSWTMGDLLYFAFRVKDEKGNKIKNRSESHAKMASKFLGGFSLPYEDGINPKIVMRVIRCLTSSIPEDKEKARKQGTAAIFAYLCDILSIDHSAITMKHRKAKQRLFDLVR